MFKNIVREVRVNIESRELVLSLALGGDITITWDKQSDALIRVMLGDVLMSKAADVKQSFFEKVSRWTGKPHAP